ncbi:tetraspanin-9-like isoform X2 [Anneissia japonica]|uniref:tetraspanin-9-like isoform X2 n=1 Tax=Anneissia japonica TaxID=1529436 RepID=UPI001425794E|nr:tetraspanin-9-like isoform X2 [Anneissia japonica]
MAVEGCGKCIKYLVFIFNLLFFFSGIGILAGGAYLASQQGGYGTLLPSIPVASAANLLIATGVIVLIVSFFGCLGAYKENPCLLMTFFLFLLLIFILELAAGIVGFIYRSDIEDYVTKDLMAGLSNYNRTNEGGLTDAWDLLQKQEMCCGVSNYTDWNVTMLYGNMNSVPASCCKGDDMSADCGDGVLSIPNPSVYTTGCKQALKDDFDKYLFQIGALGIAIGLFQIVGLALSLILYYQVKGAEQ